MTLPKVLVVGAGGRLGCPLLAVLAASGFPAHGADLDESAVAAINGGVPPGRVNEPGLAELLAEHRPTATVDVEEGASGADVVFIVVPTPSGSDDRFDASMVHAAVTEVVRGFERRAHSQDVDWHPVIVLTSTVMPGECERLIHEVHCVTGWHEGDKYSMVYSPAFIALGSVVHDLCNADVTYLGCSNDRGADIVGAIFARVTSNAVQMRMPVVDAEVAKLSLNVALTVKIGFANTVARVCESVPGADAANVLTAVGADTRIGSKYLRVGGPPGGNCLPTGGLVQTEYGLRAIETLEIGDRVLSHDGLLHPITEIYQRPYEGELVSIHAMGFSGHPIRVTPEHPVWALKRYTDDRPYMYVTTGGPRMDEPDRTNWEPEWIDAQDIVQGDYIMSPRPSAPYEFEDWVSLSSYPPSQVPVETRLNAPLCYAFGLYVAEGSTWQKEIHYSLHLKETDLAHDVTDILFHHFGIRGNCSPTHGYAMRVRFNCLALAEWLAATFGRGAENKRIPHQWLYLPTDMLESLLQGLWYGDGSCSGDVFTYGTTSRELWNFIKQAFLRLGIAFNTNIQKERVGADGSSHRQAYYLRVSNPDFFSRMNQLLPRLAVPERKNGRRTIWFEGNNLVSPVRSVTREPYVGTVWNLEVHEAESYVVESGTVHNCFPRDLRAFETLAKDVTCTSSLAEAAQGAAADVTEWVVREVEVADVERREKGEPARVGILGLSFKENIGIQTESLGWSVAETLVRLGYRVYVDDPHVVAIPPGCHALGTLETLELPVLVLACAHDEYVGLPALHGQTLIDCWSICRTDGSGRVVRPGVGPGIPR